MHAHARRTIAAILACIAGASHAEPIDALKPMAFLAGHCWKGSFPDGRQTDEHCFAWLYGGKALRDSHTVRAPGHADYVGETTYYWDSAAKRIEFLYIENMGGISRGTVESGRDALVFPPAQYVGGDEAMTYRVRWTRQGEDAFEAWSESKDLNGWTTMFKMVLRRQ